MGRIPQIEDLQALDSLHAACAHLKAQFSIGMTRNEAKSNLDARAILFNRANQILGECGNGITREEVEGCLILDRELDDDFPVNQ